MSSKRYMFCNNCGKHGHLFHKCKRPITSIGIIVFRIKNNKREYLIICRRNSLGYVDFMRGKYPLSNKLYIQNIIDEMTTIEKHNLLNNKFDELWKELWGEYVGCQYRGEESHSREKFNCIKNGITSYYNKNHISLLKLIEESRTNWIEPEWGFPKGRRNFQENDLNCAFREFEEETGYSKQQLNLLQNVMPFEEIFTGSNLKSYKHKYYIANINCNEKRNFDFQESEVSQIKWVSLNECILKIRPYNLEKIDLIKKIDKVLEGNRLIL